MNKIQLQVYSEKAAKEILKALKKSDAKGIKGEGRFKVIATTEGVDRDGEVIMVDGWDFGNFMKNPIILWGHNYWDMNAVIAAADKIEVAEIDGKKAVVVEGVFANTECGQKARQLYEDGILKTVSVGFIPKERNGNIITKAELLEVSFVSVPANPEALALEKMNKFASMFTTKAIPNEQGDGDGTESSTTEQAAEGAQTQEEATAETSEQKIARLEKELASFQAEAKAGRVLSEKNRTLVKSCIESLQALYDASEPEKAVLADTAKKLQFDLQGLVKVMEQSIKNAKTLSSNM